jgi:hypothetical protein
MRHPLHAADHASLSALSWPRIARAYPPSMPRTARRVPFVDRFKAQDRSWSRSSSRPQLVSPTGAIQPPGERWPSGRTGTLPLGSCELSYTFVVSQEGASWSRARRMRFSLPSSCRARAQPKPRRASLAVTLPIQRSRAAPPARRMRLSLPSSCPARAQPKPRRASLAVTLPVQRSRQPSLERSRNGGPY